MPGTREGIKLRPSNIYLVGADKAITQGVNNNARNHVCVVYGYSQGLMVNVWVHHGSVLNSLLFIIVLEALSLSSVLRSGAPWEDIYSDLSVTANIN